MHCPTCKTRCRREAEECPQCGLIFTKWVSSETRKSLRQYDRAVRARISRAQNFFSGGSPRALSAAAMAALIGLGTARALKSPAGPVPTVAKAAAARPQSPRLFRRGDKLYLKGRVHNPTDMRMRGVILPVTITGSSFKGPIELGDIDPHQTLDLGRLVFNFPAAERGVKRFSYKFGRLSFTYEAVAGESFPP